MPMRLRALSSRFALLLLSVLLLATAVAAQEACETEKDSAQDASCGPQFACDDPETGVHWAPDVYEAMKKGRAEGKPVMLVFSVRFMGDPLASKH